ncbi:hypothetical protein QR680_009699 [Steinernema hermaphroditum]|uniref:Uncharacterized protein n=1 Tax=Steinernema hermaphroditum TaxID=289476 RepID=A0AA39IMM1_9BILA|nr:hypothetical protein QR680_009699 [Steinernema hermaphroditum]
MLDPAPLTPPPLVSGPQTIHLHLQYPWYSVQRSAARVVRRPNSLPRDHIDDLFAQIGGKPHGRRAAGFITLGLSARFAHSSDSSSPWKPDT